MPLFGLESFKVFESIIFFKVLCSAIFIGTVFHPPKITHISSLQTQESFEQVVTIGKEFQPGTIKWQERLLEDIESFTGTKGNELDQAEEKFKEVLKFKEEHKDDKHQMPSISGIKFNNDMWQQFDFNFNGKSLAVYLFGAYLDIREQSGIGDNILVTGMSKSNKTLHGGKCVIWYGDGTSQRKEIVEFTVLRTRGVVFPNETVFPDVLLYPIKFRCRIPKFDGARPKFVSIMSKDQGVPSNVLTVVFNQPKYNQDVKKDIMICSKYIGIPQVRFAPRFMEWIEFADLMGVRKVNVPVSYLGSTMRTVMMHYQAKNMLQMTKMTLPGFQPNTPTMTKKFLVINGIIHTEFPFYLDCFYSNMYKFGYVALLDFDEMIVPLKAQSWPAMLDSFQPGIDSYHFTGAYFFNDTISAQAKKLINEREIPSYMHMSTNLVRSNRLDYEIGKSIHRTDTVESMCGHFATACISPESKHTVNCSVKKVHFKVATNQHYKASCAGDLTFDECKQLFKESTSLQPRMVSYSKKLKTRILHALSDLRLPKLSEHLRIN